MRVEERLLKYVSYWTTSDEECRQIPSSERQFELGKVLEQELRDLGLEKVTLTDHCYVYGLLPATKGYADKPAVGLFPIWTLLLIFLEKMSNHRSFRIMTAMMFF